MPAAERFRQLQELFHAALKLPPAERQAFLRARCLGDESLRQEVESLLAEDAHSSGFLATGWETKRPAAFALSSGARLGPYEILGVIGAGGMGEVYRARDTKLHRDVAVKVLPEGFANDPERMSRFQREAQLLAALNHPNIAAIYGLEESSCGLALVTELVEGPTLAERITTGPIPFEEALGIAKQIAEALEAAHERGIIHRDLKPANVKITPEGPVKVLDFGLGKVIDDAASRKDNPENLTTLTQDTTRVGVILGTAAYMSPEQAGGKPVDRRADIWPFGAVFFEMLSGKRAFEGESVSETLGKVLHIDPDWSVLPALTPLPIRKLVRRCLTRDRRQRLQAIGEARIIIEGILSGAVEETQAVPERPDSRFRFVPWIIATVSAIAALVLAFGLLRPVTSVPRLVRFSVLPPERATFHQPMSPPAVSPDGRRLAFVADINGHTALWIRDLDSLTARQLPGTDGAFLPFWSPDSRFLGFFAAGRLKSVDLAGGPILTLCEASMSARGGTWSKDGIIVLAPTSSGGLFRVAAAGGKATPATEFDPSSEFTHRFPWFLPDGRHYLYSAGTLGDINSAGTMGAGDTGVFQNLKVYVGDLDSNTRRRVLLANSNVIYSPPGLLLFLRERTLMAQPFDAAKLETTGNAVPIAEQVDLLANQLDGIFSASQNGVLAYTAGSAGEQVQLTWMDRSGKAAGTLGPADYFRWQGISPDGNTVVVDRLDAQTGSRDLWLFNLARGGSTRFTFGPRINQFPVWSPDGSRIAFETIRSGGGSELHQKGLNGAAEEALETSTVRKRPADFSPDGRYLVEEVGSLSGKTGVDIWLLPLFGDRKPIPYLQSAANERFPRVSPNGKWLAYASDETKQQEIYVQSFPVPGGKQQISTNGGTYPQWSRNGKELFFFSLDDKLMVVDVKASGDNFDAGAPRPLFGAHPATTNPRFDVSRNGRFLMPVPMGQQGASQIMVVLNWTGH